MSALARNVATRSEVGVFTAMSREILSFALSKLKPLPAIFNITFGIDTVNGITRCAATSFTFQPVHRLCVSHASSSRVSR